MESRYASGPRAASVKAKKISPLRRPQESPETMLTAEPAKVVMSAANSNAVFCSAANAVLSTTSRAFALRVKSGRPAVHRDWKGGDDLGDWACGRSTADRVSTSLPPPSAMGQPPLPEPPEASETAAGEGFHRRLLGLIHHRHPLHRRALFPLPNQRRLLRGGFRHSLGGCARRDRRHFRRPPHSPPWVVTNGMPRGQR